MQSILAAWRVSLHRTRADWPIVAAAGLIALLAATHLASGPIYSLAVAEGTTAIVATHDPALIDLADRVLELRDGKVIGETWPSRSR